MPKGIIIAAPASSSGKTTVTLGLLRALRRKGIDVASAKVGPDYIDPAFHAAATDGAHLGCAFAPLSDGSTASLARRTGWPVLLVVDAARQAQSVAALVGGFARFDPDVRLTGVILNKVGSDRHETMLRQALTAAGHAVLGAVRADTRIARPSRHLGLVQAGEHPDLEAFLEVAADRMAADLDLDAIMADATPSTGAAETGVATPPLPPLGQRIAIARDAAFAFSYPHVLDGWGRAGAELSFFSPLGDEAPATDADAVYLPGGYPELHAPHLAAAHSFMDALRAHAAAGARIYGECGGYMVLGKSMMDANGAHHQMAGLLPHETSFAEPKRHLGYRVATLLEETPLGPAGSVWRGHEFHYASTVGPGNSEPLFQISDAAGTGLGEIGERNRAVFGSFMHLIDRSDA